MIGLSATVREHKDAFVSSMNAFIKPTNLFQNPIVAVVKRLVRIEKPLIAFFGAQSANRPAFLTLALASGAVCLSLGPSPRENHPRSRDSSPRPER